MQVVESVKQSCSIEPLGEAMKGNPVFAKEPVILKVDASKLRFQRRNLTEPKGTLKSMKL